MIEFIVNDTHFITKLFFGLILLFLGFYQNLKIDSIRKNGALVNGEITDYIEQIDDLSDYQKVFYYPIIEFTDSNSIKRKIIDYSIGVSIKPNKVLPLKTKLHYIEKNGVFEIITQSNRNDIIPMLFLIIGIIVTLTTLFFHFYK